MAQGGTINYGGQPFYPNNYYMVGDIYLTMNGDVDPAKRFGGTWELIAKGKTLIGVDADDTDFSEVGLTGGEKTHTLTTDEVPAHTHTLTNNGNTSRKITINAATGVNTNYNMHYSSSTATNKGPYIVTTSVGGGGSHNNLPPYITCYIWERIA